MLENECNGNEMYKIIDYKNYKAAVIEQWNSIYVNKNSISANKNTIFCYWK